MTSSWQRWKGIMKCYPFEEKRLLKWQPPYIVQIKYDGDRARNAPLHEASILLTSEENIFYGVPHIVKQLNNGNLWKLPLDGELYDHDVFLEGGHELVHGIVSRTVNIHPRHKEIDFHVVDLKIPGLSQMERILKLQKLGDTQLPPNIKIAPFWICETLDEIKSVYDRIIRMKYEGIIVRHLYGLYEDKRSTMVMKFKPKKKDIYTIVGWNEETTMDGIPKGRIGSLILSSQLGDEFSVGAGLDDNEKDYLWKIKETLPGKKAVVHFQHLTNKKIPKGSFDIEILDLHQEESLNG